MRTARPQVPHVLAPTLDLGVRRGDISGANVTLERITKDSLAPCEQHCREGMAYGQDVRLSYMRRGIRVKKVDG
jgi:hypothetical protein